jgi:hypothetical protein
LAALDKAVDPVVASETYGVALGSRHTDGSTQREIAEAHSIGARRKVRQQHLASPLPALRNYSLLIITIQCVSLLQLNCKRISRLTLFGAKCSMAEGGQHDKSAALAARL